MRLPRTTQVLPACAVALLALLAGCGPKEQLSPVTGRVTYAGQPVANASIVFQQSETGIHVAAELDDQGEYRVVTAQGAGLPTGNYTIAIVPKSFEEAGPVDPRLSAPGNAPARYDIPEHFRSARSSGLQFQVTEGANRFDIDLAETPPTERSF